MSYNIRVLEIQPARFRKKEGKFEIGLRRLMYRMTPSVAFTVNSLLLALTATQDPHPNPLLLSTEAFLAVTMPAALWIAGWISPDSLPVAIGTHMSIYRRRHHALLSRKLSDGTKIFPGDRLGEIHLMRNIPKPDDPTKFHTYSRHLYGDIQQDLRQLATMVRFDPGYSDIKAIYGFSHLAKPIAKRLGFDIFHGRNPLKKAFFHLVILGDRQEFKVVPREKGLLSFFKSANFAYMSRGTLLKKYGNQPLPARLMIDQGE